MNQVQKITSQLDQLKPVLKKSYHINKIGLFGSQITGQQKTSSDVDLLVSFSRPVGLFHLINLKTLLSQRLKHKVDLVLEKSLKPVIGKYIRQQVSYL